VDLPNSLDQVAELKSGRLSTVEAIVENQLSKTTWNCRVMYRVDGLRTMGTVLACWEDSTMWMQRVE
jgi:hypothetical protein